MFGLITKKNHKQILSKQQEEFNKLLSKKQIDLNKSIEEKIQLETKYKDSITELKNELETKDSNLQKLEKELRKLEDDYEDLKDDYDDIDKSLREKKEALKQLNNEKDSLEKQNKKIQSDKEELEIKLKEQNKDINLKNGSLDFVTEILTAKESNDNKSSEYYKKIDTIVDYIQNDFNDCVKDAFPEEYKKKKSYFEDDLLSWAATEKKTWIKNKTAIAFVGEFSAGKTSIVNKILSKGGSSLSLPVETKATTAIPTYISNTIAKNISYNFFTQDNKLKGITENTFEKVDKAILAEVEGISSLIKYFVIKCPNKNLKNLSILDTPGFSSNDNEDSERTLDVINECDALFWVFDVNTGTINNSSLKIIKENLRKPLYIVINKIDTKTEKEVSDVEKLIKETFKKESIEIKDVLRFSKNYEIDIILKAFESIPQNNDSSDYVKLIIEFIKSQTKGVNNEVKEIAYKYNKKITEAAFIYQNEIKNTTKKINFICEDITAQIDKSKKKSLFRKEIYELKEENKVTIESNFDIINTEIPYLNSKVSEYSGLKEEYTKLDLQHKQKSSQLNELKKCENRIKKLISEL